MIFFTVLMLFLISVFGATSSVVDILAMEQEARCGQEEHVHSSQCYLDKVLVCGTSAHVHSEDCYLLRLKDNNINVLLNQVAAAEDRNLETVLMVATNENGVQTASLNEESVPLVLNEGLTTTAVTYAAADISTANNALNIMAYLDGKWQCISTTSFTSNGYGWNRNRYISSANLLAAINEAVDPDYSSTNELRFRYSTAETSGYSSTSTASSGITFGSYSTQAIYVRLYKSGTSGSSNTNAVAFTSVKYIYTEESEKNSSAIIRTGTEIELDENYQWTRTDTAVTGKEVSGSQVAENGPVTFTAGVGDVTVTCTENGIIVAQKTEKGGMDSYTLPDFSGSFDKWVDEDGNEYDPGDIIRDIRTDMTFTAAKYCTVTYIFENSQNSVQVLSGKTVTLPALDASYTWSGSDGISYAPGENVTITRDIVFTSMQAIDIIYQVGFDRNKYTTINIIEVTPTVNGSTTQAVAQGNSAVIRDVSDRNVTGTLITASNRYGTVHFIGWQVGNSDTILHPNTRLSWEEVADYSENGELVLTGLWDYHSRSSVNFFIKYNGEIFNEDGSVITGAPGNYTGVIFSTYAGGVDTTKGLDEMNETVGIPKDDEVGVSSVALDKRVRGLYGERSDGIWLAEFPKDEDMFDTLESYAANGQLTYTDINGNTATVRAEDLNKDEYEIRWYSFRLAWDGSDLTWHVDGALVKKVGMIDITKRFSGNAAAVAEAKNGFSMTATNGSITQYMNLSNADKYDPATDTYTWRIENTEYGEEWTVTEYPSDASDLIRFSEWRIIDANGLNTHTTGSGTSFKVKGVTHAIDTETGEWVSAGFNNIYYPKDSLMIKKADALTAESLAGAEFALYQNGKRLTFDYDDVTQTYKYNSLGQGEYSSLVGNGYINISTEGFSYDNGDITVKELKAPEGYMQVGEIVLGNLNNTGNIGIKNGADAFASYYDGLLVVENGSHSIDVTAKKVWNGTERADVTVELLANGSTNFAAELLTGSGVKLTEVLTSTNGYSYTWRNLPVYANGSVVEWSIREIRIGTEACKLDYTFANWINSYEPPIYDEGDNITLVVENTPKRPLVYLNKTDMSGKVPLSGVEFRLVEVNADGTEIGIPKTAVTGSGGTLIFDNIRYETRYKLTETKPPGGYIGFTEPAYFVVYDGGQIVVESHENVSMGTVAYNLQVTNTGAEPMPETGGNRMLWTAAGISLMAASVLLHNRNKNRREGKPF